MSSTRYDVFRNWTQHRELLAKPQGPAESVSLDQLRALVNPQTSQHLAGALNNQTLLKVNYVKQAKHEQKLEQILSDLLP
jgi:hypothetical protein